MMIEQDVRGGIRFTTDTAGTYLAEFIPPVPGHPGLVAREGEWKLSKLTYHKTREGRKVQRPRNKQLPREKLVDYFNSLDDCRTYLRKIEEG